MRAMKLFWLAALSSAFADALGRGAKVALTQEMLNRAKDVAVPILVTYLANIPVPDQDLGTIKLKDISLHVENEPGSSLDLQDPNEAHVAITGLKVSAHLTVKLWIVHCGATARTSGADLSLTMGAVANDAGTLTFSVSDVAVDLGDFGIKMDDWGCDVINSIVGWFLNEKDEVQSSIKNALSGLADELNSLIAQWSYQVPTSVMGLPAPLDQATLDLHFTDVEVAHAVGSGKAYGQLGVTGEVRDAASPSKVTPLVVPALPDMTEAEMTGHTVTAEISSYTINSGLYTFGQQSALSYFLDSDTLDEDTREALRTDSPVWGILEFEWETVFDGAKNMSLRLEASSQPQVEIVESGITLDTDFDFIFVADNSSEGEPVNPVTAVVFTCPLHAQGDFFVNSSLGPIALLIQLHNDANCTLSNKSSIVPVGVSGLLFLNEILLPQWLPAIVDKFNGLINKGIQIPNIEWESPNGLLEVVFENATLALGSGTATAGVDVKSGLSSNKSPTPKGTNQWQQVLADIREKIFHQVPVGALPAAYSDDSAFKLLV